MTALRLQPETEAVRDLTSRANAASSTVKPTLTVRCQKCQGVLGHAGYTDVGPLWTASWTTDPDPIPEMDVLTEQGKLTGRGKARHLKSSTFIHFQGDDPGLERGRDGYVALLALPPCVADDYPDLYVRCVDHGDVVLDRLELLEHLRRHKSLWKVQTSYPLHEIDGIPRDWMPSALQ